MAVLTATRRDTKLDRLARQPLLASCHATDLVRIARIFDEIDVAPGGVVLDAGPLARWFVLIDEGQADVVSGGVTRTALGPGGACGAESLLLRSAQASTVVARTEVRAFVASGRDLLGALGDIPALARSPLATLV